MKINLAQIGLYLGPLSFILIINLVQTSDLSPEGLSMLGLAAWMAIWWISEALPIAATAFLPLIFMPTLGILPIADTSANYMHPTVMLYMGGFLMATGIEKWNLHRRIALSIINLIGTDLRTIVLGFILATGFLSMWISNSATSLMMLPIGLAVVKQFQSQIENNNSLSQNLGKNIMLGIAYGASIGGIATLIGTPTNTIMVAVISDLYDYTIGFNEWFLFGLPLSLFLLFVTWYYLISYANPLPKKFKLENAKSIVGKQLADLGKMSYEEKSVLIVFGLVCFSWIFREYLLQPLIPAINDTIIVLTGVVLLFVLPDSTKTKRILDWKTAERIPWGILILFGGGLALAQGFQATGLAVWIGQKFTLIDGVGFFILLLIIVASVNFLTEVTSNVATASMLLPILASVASKLDLHPFGLMVGATLAASCAFMLPVATPPNAVVFGSGFLQMRDMVKAGFWLNLLSVLLITLMVFFVLPWFWGLDLLSNPF
ncbi:solute carrier family 13 (sodium-dependent dicarboxylate transporter), member 2/3/5 [Algoriphagus faecimaris]|uniref:Solute carrier family 13 (Sodium-dependent dicarboxylate transporter), member 2/3/5 n=1 Tax=Algoriphagus faecimaris TaxID=686796 RepID=A0A1G6PN26_9BACT|nr:DASS family sodium-coupled anion symporter [Algoriphagus faecimaris]SDC81034.1 solute carrier family 13 (sodium-dependent dicarboxylate transporter), member 2/3/5 [Algoriphagus faecimaris]